MIELTEERVERGRLVLVRCAHGRYHPMLSRVSPVGLSLWCRDCKCEHILSWAEVRRLEAELVPAGQTCSSAQSVLP